jgi:hypothetical protein
MRGPALPEVDIRARTALALLQARRGQTDAAREQFARIFQLYPAGSAGQSGNGYLIALYSAAEFYDTRPEVRDVDRAHAYYRRYLSRIRPLLRSGSLAAMDRRMHQAWAKRAEARLRFLKENFLDYR